MTEENNRKGPGIFYAVTGVATLVVAIIGATFAFFSASAAGENSTTIQGQTASTASVGLDVRAVYPESVDLQGLSGRMIPLESGEAQAEGATLTTTDSLMATALGNKCVSKGYVACQVYAVEVSNGGSDPVTVTPTVTLDATGFTNLRWQMLTGDEVEGFALDAEHTAVKNATPDELNDVEGLVVDTDEADATQYFVVWLEESGIDQADETKLTFGGTVSIDVMDANGNTFNDQLTATFS